MLWICYEYAMITWITLRWIEKCCHHEVFWCGIQSKINWSRSRALLSTTCIFFEQVLATSNFCSKKKKAQSRQLEAATSGYNLADADSYHVVPRISPSDDSSTFNDSLLALRTHKIHQPELVLQHGAFGFWTLHHFAADIGDVWRVHSVDAKTVKGVQDKCVMPPTLFHDRRWQALWLLNIVDLGCKRTCHDFSRLQMIDTIDTIDPQHPVAFSHWQFAWGAKLVRSQRLGNELWTVHSSDLGVFLVRWNSPGFWVFQKVLVRAFNLNLLFNMFVTVSSKAGVDSSFCYHSGFWWDTFHHNQRRSFTATNGPLSLRSWNKSSWPQQNWVVTTGGSRGRRAEGAAAGVAWDPSTFFLFFVFFPFAFSILFLFFETYFLPHTLLCSVLLNERLEGHGWCQTETQSSAARGLLPQGTHEELPVVASSRALERCAPGESFGGQQVLCIGYSGYIL